MPSNTINNILYTKRTLEDVEKYGQWFQFGHTRFDASEICLIRYDSGRILYLNFKNGYELELWFQIEQHAKDAHNDINRSIQKTDLSELMSLKFTEGVKKIFGSKRAL